MVSFIKNVTSNLKCALQPNLYVLIISSRDGNWKKVGRRPTLRASTACYFWASGKNPLSSEVPQGFIIGRAPGAHVSGWWSNVIYQQIQKIRKYT